MPTDMVIGDAINFEELKQALSDAPDLTTKYVKGELFRFARRVRRRTIQQMTGAKARGPEAKSPGDALFGGQFKRGNHVNAFTAGSDLSSLRAVNKISRILRVHEEGATITAKGAGFLFLSRKTQVAGKGKLFARVRSVTIPPRLKFQQAWKEQMPDGTRRVHDAMERAMRVAMERRMKALSSVVQRVVA